MKIKRGDTREDGKIFWHYNKCSKNGEQWITKEQFDKYKKDIAYYARKWNRENPREKTNKALKHNYGITIDQYESMMSSQNGVCFICKNKCKTGKRLCVDHCHKTGKVRALLCTNCNTGIAHFKDIPELLRTAANYLDLFNFDSIR